MTEELLAQIPDNYADAEWLENNAQDIYRMLRPALRDPNTANQAVEALLLFFPYLLNRGDLRRWNKLAIRAMKAITAQQRRQASEEQPASVMEQVYILPDYAAAHALPRRPRSERIDQREMFEVYFELLMTQIYHQPTKESLTRILDSALLFARTLNHQFYYHKLYQTLAYIYTYHGELDKALDYARMSYDFWVETRDTQEMALTASVLAWIYQGKQIWDKALEWMEKAADLFSKTNNSRQYGLISIQTAHFHIHQKNYDAAEQWSQMSLDEFRSLGMTYQSGMAYHALGMSQTYLRKHAEARENLLESIQVWEEFEDERQAAHTEHTLAFNEAMQGNKEEAMRLLEQGRVRWDRVPDSAWKDRQLAKIDRLVRAIENNETLPLGE